MCKQTCENWIHGIIDKQLFDTNHYRHTNNCECFNYYTPYSITLIRICLVMRSQNKHKHKETTIDKIVL